MLIKRPGDVRSSEITDKATFMNRRLFIDTAASVLGLGALAGEAKEIRLPGFFRNRATDVFNGYGDQVAGLYAGMDLKRNF